MVILYIATSIDGRIADENGGVGWLDNFGTGDMNYEEFYGGIESIVMGRATYDQCLTFGEWPYAGKHCVVLTSRPLENPPPGVIAMSGNAREVHDEIMRTNPGAIWLLGGAEVNKQFLAEGLIDVVEIYVAPVVLGKGPSLFGDSPLTDTFSFVDSTVYSDGMVRLRYESTSSS